MAEKQKPIAKVVTFEVVKEFNSSIESVDLSFESFK